MLQTFNPPQQGVYDDFASGLDPGRLVAIMRRRIFYFVVPCAAFFIVGFLIVIIQRPIYEAEGKILVESPEIPTTLVQPTVTTAATERVQVIEQRIMTRENLLTIINKFDLFPSQRKWMSETQLVDLMRERATIALLDIDSAMVSAKGGKPVVRFNNKTSATAFTVSFDYEMPDLALRVANEFLSLVLNEDVRARTNRAIETTQFLTREVKRLQDELDAVQTQLITYSSAPLDQGAEQLKTQVAMLTAMKEDLAAKSSVYSEEHPVIRSLKKKIAAIEKDIAHTRAARTSSKHEGTAENVDALTERQKNLQQELDETTKKLTAARLGESMERDQQAEHLQVIEQPALPQRPIRPKRSKLFALAFAVSAAAGIGAVALAEVLDKSIHGAADLAGVVDSHLLVVIPYISTAGETARRRRRMILLCAILATIFAAGLAAAFYVGVEMDFSWLDHSWIDSLTRLTK